MTLQSLRTADLSVNGKYLYVYGNTDNKFSKKEIFADLKQRGLSKYDLSVIDEHYMLLCDGPVAITSSMLDSGKRAQSNCIKRIFDILT